MLRRTFLLGAPALGLAACSGEPVWAPDADIARAMVTGFGAPSITLYTMKNVGSDNGAHSGLLVNASQRVLFDPAGTFGHSSIPERNDVLFGFSQRVETYYVSYHARASYYVIGQKVEVPAAVAEQALRLVLNNGAVPKAHCALATSRILRQLPGFETLPGTYFPDNLSDAFGQLPGVAEREYRENDGDDKRVAAQQINRALTTDPSQ